MRADNTEKAPLHTQPRATTRANEKPGSLNVSPQTTNIAIIGLGYVGLPLAVAFGQKFPTTGFDIKPERVTQLRDGHDNTREADPEQLASASRLSFVDQESELAACNVYIVTVPTPIDSARRPDLAPLKSASATIGKHLSTGDVVIYESTVYPGCTEEVCAPILENASGLKLNEDFFVGYSPERINPGDREHRLENIVKITSGSNREAAEFVDGLYRQIIQAGTHPTSSICVAEAAKAIENTQRDLNIALVNELAMLFSRLRIDTTEVLEAANTKWNFLPFKPGLVGGHCISVDPYYLTHKAQEIGHHPDVILAGRRTNDGMGRFVASEILRAMIKAQVYRPGARVLVLGLAFKENCPDLRNTRVVDVVGELQEYQLKVDVYDPWVDADEAHCEYGLTPIQYPESGAYEGIVLAVAHNEFAELGITGLRNFGRPGAIVYDLKSLLPQDTVTGRL